MPLPKIDQPLFELTLPSSGKKIKYRPFTVKEEKILLIAKESKDVGDMLNAIEQVVNNCIMSDKIGVEDLATFDLEYLMLNIRSKAVNDIVKFSIRDPDTEEEVELEFDIKNIEVKRDENHKKDIKVDDTYSIRMRYPTTKELAILSGAKEVTEEESILEIMVSCVELLYSENETFKMKDFTKEEIDDFVESLPSLAIQGIRNFFATLPKLRIECPYTNKEGKEKRFVVEGMETFFM